MSSDKAPAPVTDAERWIVHNSVVAVRAYFKFTSEDTSDDYLELTTGNGEKVNWLRSTFNAVADWEHHGSRLARPKYGVRERVEAREKYEKANAAELATYKRLKAKYEPRIQPDGQGY